MLLEHMPSRPVLRALQVPARPRWVHSDDYEDPHDRDVLTIYPDYTEELAAPDDHLGHRARQHYPRRATIRHEK